MAEEYHYRVDERSLTQDFLTKICWTPVVKRIPARITPNSITVFGAMFMLFSIVWIWAAIHGHPLAFLGAALCVFVYMTADNVDGAHARRTGQSSRLGEFLDHWLDSINMVIINMSLILCLGFFNWILAVVTGCIAVAFFATLWEHHHTGVFYSGRLGTNEGLLLVIGLYILLCLAPQSSWILYGGPSRLTLASAFAYLTIAVCLVTAAKSVLRVRKKITEFIPLLLAIAAIVILAWKGLDKRLAAMAILCSNTLFAGPFLLGRLTGRSHAFRKWAVTAISLAVIAAALANVQSSINTEEIRYYLYAAGALVFLVPMALDLGRAVTSLKQ